MNYLVQEAVGIDAQISKVQQEIYDGISYKWKFNIDGFGRVYKNPKNNNLIPEAYIGNNEYVDVFLNDNINGHFFFLASDTHETSDEIVFTTDVKIVFILNLEKIYGNTGRSDALAHKDAVEVVRKTGKGRYQIKELQTGISNIFSGFSTESIKLDDMHPFHCFSINVEFYYYLTDSCS